MSLNGPEKPQLGTPAHTHWPRAELWAEDAGLQINHVSWVDLALMLVSWMDIALHLSLGWTWPHACLLDGPWPHACLLDGSLACRL